MEHFLIAQETLLNPPWNILVPFWIAGSLLLAGMMVRWWRKNRVVRV